MHRIALAIAFLCGLYGLAASPAQAQSLARAIRETEHELRMVRARSHDYFMNAHPGTFEVIRATTPSAVLDVDRDQLPPFMPLGARSGGASLPPPDCIQWDDHSCLKGDYECISCLWNDDAMYRLAEIYERAAERIGAPPPRVDIEMLDWFAGQRVGVWTHLGELARAQRAATECHAQFWWCEALRGRVAHAAGDITGAEELFASALRNMSRGRACFWRELHVYHDSLTGTPGATPSIGFDAFRRYRFEPEPDYERPCPDSAAVNRFWVLADPLFTRAGNDRLTEHYARLVEAHIHALFRANAVRYPDAEGGSHWPSHHSVLMRRGLPIGRSRSHVPIRFAARSAGGTAPVYDTRGQSFLITAPLEDALRAQQHLFALDSARIAESHRPTYGPIRALPLQTGFFRRNGETVLLVRASTPAHGEPMPHAWQLRSWDGTAWRDAPVLRIGAALTAWLPTPWIPQVVSLEGMHSSGAWRARTGNRPPTSSATRALSSLIIVTPDDTEPDLEDAARAMLPRTTFSPRDRVGGYFELYTTDTRNATIELSIIPIDEGFLNRLGIGRDPIRSVRWTELLEPVEGVVARAVALDLVALPAGSYDIQLTLRLDTAETLTTLTHVVILPQ